MPQQYDFYGKDVAKAIENACSGLNVRHEQLDVEIVTAGSNGIFGFGRKDAHIRVVVKQGEDRGACDPVGVSDIFADSFAAAKGEAKQSAVGRKQASERREPFVAEDEENLLQPADIAWMEQQLLDIITLMGFAATVTTTLSGRNVDMALNSDDEKALLGEDGRVLDSLQYLLRKIAGRKFARSIRINLDLGDYRSRRLEEMKALAVELAEQVKEDGRTRAISALSPAERREIHLHLQDDDQIRSRSVGEGMFKKVLIYKPGSNKGHRAVRGGRRNRPQNQKESF